MSQGAVRIQRLLPPESLAPKRALVAFQSAPGQGPKALAKQATETEPSSGLQLKQAQRVAEVWSRHTALAAKLALHESELLPETSGSWSRGLCSSGRGRAGGRPRSSPLLILLSPNSPKPLKAHSSTLLTRFEFDPSPRGGWVGKKSFLDT